MKIICYSCRKETEWPDKIGRRDVCPFCNVDLHCCKQCRFYDPNTYNECREPQAERVLEKNRANFCGYFSAKEDLAHTVSVADEAKKKLESLFKK